MFRAALRYPFRADGDRSALDVVLIGGGLHLLAAFVPVLPLVAVAGYLVRVLDHAAGTDRTAFRTDAAPPDFGGLRGARGLFADGLAVVAVALAYLLLPLAVLVITVRGLGLAGFGAGGPAAGTGTGGQALGTASGDPALESVTGGPGVGTAIDGPTLGASGADFGTGVGLLAGSTAAVLLAFAFVYPLPAALTAYARRRDLRAAFDPDLLWPLVTDARYLAAVLVGLAGVGLASALAGPLNRLALGFFVRFYAETFAAALCGHAVASIRPAEEDRSPGPSG